MGFKLFDELSNEDIGDTTECSPVLSIEDVMAADMANDDVNEAINEIESYTRVIEDGESVASGLKEQISIESAIVAEPEKVTAATAVLSYESLKITASLLGADIDSMSISLEAMEKSPVTALEISIEEKENFLKKVIDKIKLIIAKVVVSIKKLTAKIIVATSNLEKKADALAAKVNEGYTPKKLSEKEREKLGKLNGTGLISGLSYADISGGLSETVTILEVYNEVLDKLVSGAKKLKNVDDDVVVRNFIEENFTKLGDDFMKKSAKMTKVDVALTKLVNDAPEKLGITPVEAGKEAVVKYVSNRYDGTAIKVIAIKSPLVDLPDEKTPLATLKKAWSLTDIKYLTGSVNDEDILKKVPETGLKKSEVLKVLKNLGKAGKGIKSFSDNTFKTVENTNKIIAALGSLDLGDAAPSFGKISGWVTVATTSVATDTILGLYKNISNTITAMNIMVNSKSDDKK